MTIQITIIGMGQIGASVGLALEKHGDKFYRVGHDKEPEASGKAKKLGALDKIGFNLPASVKKADVILLAIPADKVLETIDLIRQDLKDGVVILDTSPVQEYFFDSIYEKLEQGQHYVGFTPLISPLFIHEVEGGTDLADARMFERGLFAICAPRKTDAAAMKLAVDMAQLMDADPLFADPAEVDSYMTATHWMPQVLAASLANITVSKPGWMEGRKFAGRPYALVSSALAYCDTPQSLASASTMNSQHAVRQIDNIIEELTALRSEIEAQDDAAIGERFTQAFKGRAKWWDERGRANWRGEESPATDIEAAKINMFGPSLSRGGPPPGLRREDD